MADVDMKKVEVVIRRMMKEYAIAAQNSDVLHDAIENVIAREDDGALKRLAEAFHYDMDRARVWRHYLEA